MTQAISRTPGRPPPRWRICSIPTSAWCSLAALVFSTASGIPDFRSVDGCITSGLPVSARTMPRTALQRHIRRSSSTLPHQDDRLNAKPNRCHTKLAELERAGK